MAPSNMFTSMLILLLATAGTTDASSSMANDCPTGKAAVGQPHLTATAVTGSLTENGYTVSLPETMTRSTIYDVVVSGTDDAVFRGFLVRVATDNVDANGGDVEVLMGENSQMASVCVLPAQGITHMEPSDKSSAAGTIMVVDDPGTTMVNVEVTVVQSNNANDGSVYFYEAFSVPVEAAMVMDEVETVAPVGTTETTSRPVGTTETTSMPSMTPPDPATTTEAPTAAPTEHVHEDGDEHEDEEKKTSAATVFTVGVASVLALAVVVL